METENNSELDDNEVTKHQHLYDMAKVIFHWKFKDLNVYISNKERLKIDKPNVQLKFLKNRINQKKVEERNYR